MKKKLVVGLGEILWDIFEDRKKPGGAPANFAHHAAQHGADGIAVSAIGKDQLGEEILEELHGKSLRNEFQRTNEPTGTVRISLDAHGIASYTFANNCAWDNLEWTPRLQNIAKNTDAVCFGSLAQRETRSRETIQTFLKHVPAGAIRIFDVNLRQNFYSEKIIRDSLALAGILKINEDELKVLAGYFSVSMDGDFAKTRDLFFSKIFEEFSSVNFIILTCGGNGSYAASREGDFSFVAADSSIEIVDTVGAGDSFTATFTVALLAGKSIFEAHRRATDVANYVCTQAGAMPEIPENLKIEISAE